MRSIAAVAAAARRVSPCAPSPPPDHSALAAPHSAYRTKSASDAGPEVFGAIDDPVRSPFEVASLGTADADASSRAAASLASSSAGRVGSEKRVSEKLVSPLGGATASEAFGGESPHAPLFSARSKTLLMVCARAARAAALSSGFCAETEIISCAATAARSDSPRSAKDSLVAAARRTATTPGASRGSSPELDAHRHTHAKIAACWACRSRVEGGAATVSSAAAAAAAATTTPKSTRWGTPRRRPRPRASPRAGARVPPRARPGPTRACLRRARRRR